MNETTGRWEMSGPYMVLVGKSSAIQRKSNKSDIIPINRSHSEMVKFSEGCDEYNLLANFIHEFVQITTEGCMLSLIPITSTHSVHAPAPSDFLSEGKFQVYFSSSFRVSQREFLALQPERLKINRYRIVSLTLLETFKMSANHIPDLSVLLASLNIPESRDRISRIEDSYQSTFGWIWEDKAAGFVSWLTNDAPIYWISGKPGSGKSTFIKYIFNNYREHSNIKSSSGQARTQLRVGFFFYDRGFYLQKSLEGLLYSILHQILRQEREFLPKLLKRYGPKKSSHDWSIESLQSALDYIVKQNETPIDLYIFLDGLDEYGGTPNSIVAFIKSLVQPPGEQCSNRVKICCSSRIWNVFCDEFHGHPGFKIHEKTHRDIIAYIDGKFDSSRSMVGLREEMDEAQRLQINELRSCLILRTEGVFLWLKLVVEEILASCAEGATVTELLAGLASFPGELEALYLHLVQRIPRTYRLEAFAVLEIVLRSDWPIEEYDFWLAVLCAPCRTIDECEGKIPIKRPGSNNMPSSFRACQEQNLKDLVGSRDHRQRRIKSRCGGLIELASSSASADPVLQFMHQTVKDFVGEPGFRQFMIVENNKSAENGYSFLAKYGLFQMNLERKTFREVDRIRGFDQSLPSWFHYLP